MKKAVWSAIGVLIAYWLIADHFEAMRENDRVAELAAKTAARDARLKAKHIKERRHNLAYFQQNRETVLNSISTDIEAEAYKRALSTFYKYRAADDEKLNELGREAEEKSLYQQVKKVPASDWNKNKELYYRLVHLAPDNGLYRQKYEFYRDKVAKQDQTQQQRRVRFGEPPERTEYGDYYFPVKLYLSQVMHDPDSLKMGRCTNAYSSDDGWVVGCSYRGANAFGALIKKENWFVIRNGRVVAVKDEDAYKP